MTTPFASALQAVRDALAVKPDGVLEALAEQHEVSYRAVLECLDPSARVAAPGADFETVWQELTNWGTVTFVVHSKDGVVEVKAPLPPGSPGRGYFNIHGDSPIGGHLKSDRCVAIVFVDRPFFGRRSCSVQFLNADDEAMFKVFVGRDEDRELIPEQLAKFEALRGRYNLA